MGHIFLSYSRKDAATMHRVMDTLRTDGLDVWTDEDLTPGARSWKRAIEEALDNADCVVVILSPDSKKSDHVADELDYAEAHDKRIFPVFARGDEKNAVPFGYITAQWVDIRQDANYAAEMQKLVFTLRVHMGLETRDKDRKLETVESPKPDDDTTDVNPQIFPQDVAKAIMVLQNRSSRWWRRVDAINHLGELRNTAALPVLKTYLDDVDLDVQHAAQKAIDKIADVVPDAPVEKPPVSAAPSQEKKSVRIVISGTSNQLRREFIQSISEVEVVSIERSVMLNGEPTLLAMDYGQITVDSDLVIYLFGCPGEQHFSYVWETLAEGMLGFVVLMDSSQPSLRESKLLIDNFVAQTPVPYVVAVDNGSDPDAWKPDDIRISLRLSGNNKVLHCLSTDHASVKNVLLELIYLISEVNDQTNSPDVGSSSGDDGKPIFALIVEDDAEIGQLIRITLQQVGIDTHHVLNGQAALDFLAERTPDVMILDIAMRGMSGWDLLETIKAYYPESRFPVVVLTAYDDPANKLIGKLQDRVFQYLTKPFNPSMLTSVIRVALDTARRQ